MGIEVQCGMVSKPCDWCNAAAALLFCRSHSAYLCLSCDERVHSGVSMHARVWMCEVCEMAPASVTCKADAAALCVICDSDIHSVNPLARRHQRIPVVPFYSTPNHPRLMSQAVPEHMQGMSEESSWVEPKPKLLSENPDTKIIEFLLSGSDQLLDFDILDGVVPVQTGKPPLPIPTPPQEKNFEIDFKKPNQNSFTSSYAAQSVSSSSLDVGVVPDGNSDISHPFALQMNTTQTKCTEREAKVMRYREKRKNRKFQKTIRYASRKAYAETRPRIKGRFAKRNEVEEDNYLSGFAMDHGYSIVPSFYMQ